MLIQDPDRKIVKYFDDGKRYRITIKSSSDAVQIYEGSENSHICFAFQLDHPRRSPLIGYAKHLGNEEHEAFPKYNWRNKQISGEADVDLADVIAWYRRYLGKPIVEEIEAD
jgi:hypothetical protein